MLRKSTVRLDLIDESYLIKCFSGINAEIVGYAKCRWEEDDGAGSSHYFRTLRGREEFINQTFCLFGELEGEQLTAGEHKFNVSYALDSNLPTSLKCKNGAIKYKVRVVVERKSSLARKSSSTFEFPFTVIKPLNLNDVRPLLTRPVKEELTKKFKMDFGSEPLFMKASVPFSGYVPGQVIDVSVLVNNQSKTNVSEMKVSLKKIVVLNSNKGKHRRTMFLTESAVKVSTEPVPVATMRDFDLKLEVPSLSPNIENCEIINVQYVVRIKAKTSGFNRSPRIDLPVTIGTVPLHFNHNPNAQSPISYRMYFKQSKFYL